MNRENVLVRVAEVEDYDRILELNEESVHFLSPMDRERLEKLVVESEIFKVVELDGKVEGFILAFREDKDYDSINYKWFSEKYDEFLYIDRAVISVEMQRKGLGEVLYNSVIKDAQVSRITAEIDIKPANPGSLEFHKNFGFEEVGQHKVAGGTKLVSLQTVEKQLIDNSI